MYVKRWIRRYRGEIRIITTLTVICLLFGIYSLLRNYVTTEVEGSTLSSNVEVEPTDSLPSHTPVPSLVVPTTVQINIYINNTTPIYNQIYSSVLTQMPTLIATQVPTSAPNPTEAPINVPKPTNTPQPTATPTFTPTPTQVPLLTSFSGSYFNNKDLSGNPVLTRTDTQIDFEWFKGSPDNAVNSDSFSAKWEGTINSEGGYYQFTTRHDDAMRIYIKNELVYNSWSNQSASWRFTTRTLEKGSFPIRIEYYENSGDATAIVSVQKL